MTLCIRLLIEIQNVLLKCGWTITKIIIILQDHQQREETWAGTCIIVL